MGLKDVFKTAAETALNVFGDVVVSAAYEAVKEPAYDIVQGATVSQNQNYAIEAVFEDFTEKDIDNSFVISGDKKALIAANTVGFTPAVNDFIVYDKVHWVVKSVSIDSAGALWTLHLTRP